MGQTDEFDLRWPELGDLADGPDGFQDLATDVENALKGLRDTNGWQSYTPTLISAGAQPSGYTAVGRYLVRAGMCTVAIYIGMGPVSQGGNGQLTVSLPVRATNQIGEQFLLTKMTLAGVGNYGGWSQVFASGLAAAPYFPGGPTVSYMGAWQSTDSSNGVGKGIPAVAGGYTWQGNVGITGSYMV